MKFLMGDVTLYVIIAILVIAVIVLAGVLIFKSVKNKKGLDKIEDQKIVIKDNVRYNADNDKVSDIKYKEHDFLLKQNTIYVVSKDGPVLPGKYIMVSALEDYKKFNVRLHGFVREHMTGEEIVLAEGEEICAVSCNVILK